MMQYESSNGFIQLKMVPSFLFQIPDSETVDSVQHFAYVLDCVSWLFLQHIPQIGSKELIIINQPNATNPVCYRSIHTIQLATTPSSWSQIAYQYAHELCHYAIPEEVDPHLRWLEESICEMASLILLREIGELWYQMKENLNTASGMPYALSFISYASNTANKHLAFNMKDENEQQILEANCYDRQRNRYIAQHLIPIFINFPQTWSAIPHLCAIHQPTLAKALDSWILESSLPTPQGLQLIRDLF